MPLTKKGAVLLEAAKQNILANPDFYDQSVTADETPCGTVCCVAGWIDYVHFGPKTHLKHTNDYGFSIWDSSAKLLGLDHMNPGLFEDEYHHQDIRFTNEYAAACTPKQRAKAAAGMIDRFIANNM